MTYLQVKTHALLMYTKMELFFALLKVHIAYYAALWRRVH